MRGCPGYREGAVLRFRKTESDSGAEFKLTYKSPMLLRDVKAREEFETELRDDSVLKILKMLGLRDIVVRKKRSYFTGVELNLSVDVVECLGSFIEFEEVNPKSAEDFLAKVRRVLRDLDLDGSELISESYLELLLASSCI